MTEHSWQISLDHAHDPLVEDLVVGVHNFVANENNLIIDEVEHRYLFNFEVNEEMPARRFQQLTRCAFFASLSSANQSEAVRGFVNDTGSWKYGLTADDNPALIDGQRALVVQTSQPSDGLILSGLAGSELLGRRKKFDRLAERLSPDPLERAVALGGIGIAAAKMYWEARRGAPSTSIYIHRNDEALPTRTEVGATLHGDFRMIRQLEFEGYALDPLGREQMAAPMLPEINIGAYHSSEPTIFATVIKHAALTQMNLVKLRDNVVSKWNERGERTSYRGNFGDFGDGDGEMEAYGLREWLKNPHTDDEGFLSSIIIMPGDYDHRLLMRSRPDGIHFSQIYESSKPDDETIIIQNNEIEDFLLALLEQAQAGLGRTSVRAFAPILDVLSEQRHHS